LTDVILGDIKLNLGVLISDIDFGIHRQRSTTAQRLEKMDQDRKKTNRIKNMKWEWSPVVLTGMSFHCLILSMTINKKDSAVLQRVESHDNFYMNLLIIFVTISI
jgi:hypothetical protein